MNVHSTELPEVKIIKPDVHHDGRGWFFEVFHSQKFYALDLPTDFVQVNHSQSIYGTLRGLHAQRKNPQGKLIRVLEGEIFDVAVDIRRNSPTFGRWVVLRLSSENSLMGFVPPGFAHGFCVLSDSARVFYKCSDYYDLHDEGGILWSDPAIAIDWPIAHPIISEKDACLPVMSDIPPEKLYNPLKAP